MQKKVAEEKVNSLVLSHLDVLCNRYPALHGCREDIACAYQIMERCYVDDGKLLLAGNGGSAADCEHIVGELMKRFKKQRPIETDLVSRLKKVDPERGAFLSSTLERGLMAISLTTHEALTTAYCNDVDGKGVFAQQLLGYARHGDVFLGISTSGNSGNILNAAVLARALGLPVVGLTGEDGGELAQIADVCVKVPARETYQVQELHLPVYHCWCMMLEERFFERTSC